MKIRIKDSSIRLRLSQSEVRMLGEQGAVLCTCALPMGASFHYSLEAGQNFFAQLESNRLRVEAPAEQLIAWANGDAVSLETSLDLGQRGPLRILIEKDFQCLSERNDEDESDLFPNPNPHC